ncbi:MAG: hypothetical protein ACRD18_12355 [Terriglobia bacterium]
MVEDASPGLEYSARWTESGRGYLSLIITLVILAALAYIGIQVVPVYVDNFQLNDYLTSLAEEVAVKRVAPAEAPAAVATKAADLNLPVQSGNVQVDNGGNSIIIRVHYAVPIDLKVYTWTLHFSDSASAPSTVY